MTTTTVDAALQQVEGYNREQEQQQAEHIANLQDQYCNILVRHCHGTPAKDDQQNLVAAVRVLELTPEQVREDAAAVEKAIRWQAARDNRDMCGPRISKTRAALNELIEKHKQELEQSQREASNAIRDLTLANDAGRELLRLYRERPHLFANGSPPMLRADTRKPSKAAKTQ